MNIKGINHIAVNTADINVSTAFYTDILGFEKIETINNGDSTITYLALPGGSRLELFDYAGKNKRVPKEESDVGLRHLAFEVDDVDAHERILREKGVKIILPATDLHHLGCRVMLFEAPDDVVIEFCKKI